MKSYRLFLTSVFLIAVTVSGCGKKSDFKSRYSKSGTGAPVADGPKADAAGEQAQARGVSADIVDIARNFVHSGQMGPDAVRLVVRINNRDIPLSTVHNGTEITEGAFNSGEFLLMYSAMCGDVGCSSYFSSIDVYRNSEKIVQLGILHHFEPSLDGGFNVYQMFTPQESKPFFVGDSWDERGMVGYLNRAQSYIANSYIE